MVFFHFIIFLFKFRGGCLARSRVTALRVCSVCPANSLPISQTLQPRLTHARTFTKLRFVVLTPSTYLKRIWQKPILFKIGEGGIRTPGEVAPTQTFQVCTLNHSDTSPYFLLNCQIICVTSGKLLSTLTAMKRYLIFPYASLLVLPLLGHLSLFFIKLSNHLCHEW